LENEVDSDIKQPLDYEKLEEYFEEEWNKFSAFEKSIYYAQEYFWITLVIVFGLGFLVGYHI